MIKKYMRYPGFLDKALTLSYDDGVAQDIRLIEIMSKYGIRGTFNINSGCFAKEPVLDKGRMSHEQVLKLYSSTDNEVAIHGYKHLSIADVDSAVAVRDVAEDRKNLENMFGKIIKGMAYANGSYNDKVVDILRECGVKYSRTTKSTEAFTLPDEWLTLHPTCHHNNPRLMELAKKFIEFSVGDKTWRNYPRMFYLWGHSYEFDNDENWNVIEEFCKYMGGRDDVWYATNGEIYDYIKAYESLEYSIDGSTVYNPTATDLYVISYVNGKEYVVHAGEKLNIG